MNYIFLKIQQQNKDVFYCQPKQCKSMLKEDVLTEGVRQLHSIPRHV